MKEVQRWECRVATNANGRPYVDDIEFAAGRYVLYSDHKAEIVRLRAEVEKYRKDAERYRWLRNADNYPNQIGGFWNCLGETSEPEEMDEAIDAAMGASA